MDKKKLKEEADRRMKALELYDSLDGSTIRDFMENDTLYSSHPVMGNRAAALFELTDVEKYIVKNFETEYGTVVYHVIRNELVPNMICPTAYSTVYSMLYVSNKKEDWKEECNGFNNFSELCIAYPKVYEWDAGNAEKDIKDISKGTGSFSTITVTAGSGDLCRLA